MPAALCCAAIAVSSPAARAGHEVPYYPSFYPQEIRIEPLDPPMAAAAFADRRDPLHAYVGAPPAFAGETPEHVKAVESLLSFVVADINPSTPIGEDGEARCQAARRIAAELAGQSEVAVHAYPITPFHADYLNHADRVLAAEATAPPGSDSRPRLKVVAGSPAAAKLTGGASAEDAGDWDARIDEVAVAKLLLAAGVGSNVWVAPPWAKDGWFQAYHLLRSTLGEAAAQARADRLYERLRQGGHTDAAERAGLERELVATLTSGCERTVIGYRLRREFYNDDFSNGIEHIVVDSQAGFNTPMFPRVTKLKDFPWNGWLRVGVGEPATAAWNPLAGFTDPAGRLVWSTVSDAAFLPVPYSSRWVANRTEVRHGPAAGAGQSTRVPPEALMPEAGSGRLAPIGAGRGATAKVTYRVLAGAAHDGTEMDIADILYPYAVAFRWGVGDGSEATFDPDIAAATELLRQRLKGVRVVDIEETTLPLADLTFTYRSPIVEVYLDGLGDDEANAVLAPPWSSVPWHVLALAEAAVERGIAAFSKSQAERSGLPWLDLVRDPAQVERLAGMAAEFARSGYRPPALEGLVTEQAAKERWRALARFAEANRHLLVTNGPYRLRSWSPEASTFDVVRDFTYPVGLGTFNAFAHPPQALITSVERAGDEVRVAVDVEMAIKEQRNRRTVRVPLEREALRDTYPILPVAHYLVIGEDGAVADAGRAVWKADGRFGIELPKAIASGQYTLYGAIFLDGNTVRPAIASLKIGSN